MSEADKIAQVILDRFIQQGKTISEADILPIVGQVALLVIRTKGNPYELGKAVLHAIIQKAPIPAELKITLVAVVDDVAIPALEDAINELKTQKKCIFGCGAKK